MSLQAVGIGAGITVIFAGVGAGLGSISTEENSMYYGLAVGGGIGLLVTAGILYYDNLPGTRELINEVRRRRMAEQAELDMIRTNPMYNVRWGYY